VSVPDEDTSRKIRAKRLREQIERLTEPGSKPEENVGEEDSESESPREFIHRRMRDLGNKGESSR
jgi:hypothetical protein